VRKLFSFSERQGEDVTSGNPCPVVDEESEDVVLLFCRENRECFRTISTDDGATWSEPVEFGDVFRGFDYDAVRIATGPVHGIRTRAGRLVAPVWLSNAELEKRVLAGGPADQFVSGALLSDDGGRTWRAGGRMEPVVAETNECTVFEREDGTLVLNMRAHKSNGRAESVSGDGGESWSPPRLREDLADPTCQGSILKLRQGGDAGAVLFSNLDMRIEDFSKVNHCAVRRNFTVRMSADDGATWPVSRVVDAGPSGYGDLAECRDGTILALFEYGPEIYNERLALARFNTAWLRGGGA
jgi:sialidase-1